MGISYSCPVASDMMYNLGGHMTFDEEITPELPSLNDIDAELYFKLFSARKEAYSILQNDNDSLADRLSRLLDLGVELQGELDEYEEGNEDIPFVDIFDNPELINQEWADKVAMPKFKSIETNFANENIAVYFIYKYMMQAVYDLDVLSKIKMAVVGVLVNTYFGEDSWTIHLWSKETEHSQYNMDRYKRLLREAECLSVEALRRRLYG